MDEIEYFCTTCARGRDGQFRFACAHCGNRGVSTRRRDRPSLTPSVPWAPTFKDRIILLHGGILIPEDEEVGLGA